MASSGSRVTSHESRVTRWFEGSLICSLLEVSLLCTRQLGRARGEHVVRWGYDGSGSGESASMPTFTMMTIGV
jgi:hypothetical protein